LKKSGAVSSGKIRRVPHGTYARAAGLFEWLHMPPTKSGRPVWFPFVEAEFGILQATIFRPVYERYGDLLHYKGAFLLGGTVEQDRRKRFSFLVERIRDLREVLKGTRVSSPKDAPGPVSPSRPTGEAGEQDNSS
jgi:error-prone DNA polymerase